jgi:hypothetical protein
VRAGPARTAPASLHAVPMCRLVQGRPGACLAPGVELISDLGQQVHHVRLGVPDGEVALFGELDHGLAVPGRSGQYDLAALLGGEPVVSPGNLQTGRQPLDVPLGSVAMISAPPRQKENGDAIIRPYRMGTSSGTRVSDWPSSSPTGSLRSAVTNSACELRGTRLRAAFPRSARSDRLRCSIVAGLRRTPGRGLAGGVMAWPPVVADVASASRSRCCGIIRRGGRADPDLVG